MRIVQMVRQASALASTYLGANGQIIVDTGAKAIRVHDAVTPGGALTMSAANNLSDLTDPATARSNIGLAIGTNVQAYNTNLAALSLQTGAANKIPYFTGLGAMSLIGASASTITFLGTPSSANLAAAITDETGSGALVFATSPTLVTPALGTPASGSLTNCLNLPVASGISGLGTGVATALAVDIGTSGAFVKQNGALGTPSSGTLTSCTGLPISTGVSGLGTGIATALAINTGSAGAPVLFNGAGGTPSSLTLTNATGLPIASGVSGLGTGIATFLATPSSANLAAALTDETGSGAAVFATSPALVTPNLGTPSAGTLTNCTLPWSGITGTPAALTNSLSGDVALNNTANYFDGPVVAQGSVGTWFVSGTVNLDDTGVGNVDFNVKLWDGTTVIASARVEQASITQAVSVSLSGVITNPAGNLRISVRDVEGTTGLILFNASGNSKDSTITAFRLS